MCQSLYILKNSITWFGIMHRTCWQLLKSRTERRYFNEEYSFKNSFRTLKTNPIWPVSLDACYRFKTAKFCTCVHTGMLSTPPSNLNCFVFSGENTTIIHSRLHLYRVWNKYCFLLLVKGTNCWWIFSVLSFKLVCDQLDYILFKPPTET